MANRKRTTSPKTRKATRITPATGNSLPVKSCPVAQLAYEQQALWETHLRLDDQHVNADGVCTKEMINDRDQRVMELVEVNEDHASYLRASSFAGALFQMMLAHSDLENLESWLPRDDESGPGHQSYRRARRLLYSAVRQIEAATGHRREGLCGNFYMSALADPLEELNQDVAACQCPGAVS
jgi:hypothetical protein